jgi:hypothetical protein
LALPVLGLANEDGKDDAVRQVVERYLKAIKAKDFDDVMKVASVPWLADAEKTIEDRDRLQAFLKDKMKSLDPNRLVGEVICVKCERWLGDSVEKRESDRFGETIRKLVTKDDYVAYVLNKSQHSISYLLVRGNKEAWTIAGGPFPLTYLLVDNSIPKAAIEILDSAEEIELYSLNPKDLTSWDELGKTTIKDADRRKKLISEFKKAIDESDGLGAACFNPRHMIKASNKGKVLTLVICFECPRVQLDINNKEKKTLYIGPGAQEFFDKTLKDAGVQLAPKPEKK